MPMPMINNLKSETNQSNRKGESGVVVAIGFHPRWLDEQRRRGSKIELIDIFSDALKFCAENSDGLHELSMRDLQKVVLP